MVGVNDSSGPPSRATAVRGSASRWATSPASAALELAGAVGVLIGLWLEPLGVAAAADLIAYFLGAVISHLRVGDTKGVAMPLLPLVLRLATL